MNSEKLKKVIKAYKHGHAYAIIECPNKDNRKNEKRKENSETHKQESTNRRGHNKISDGVNK